MLIKQFQLVRYGRFSLSDLDELTIPEVDWFWNKLREDEEQKAEALKSR